MIFRSARHTNQLQTMIKFYTEVLDLEVLGTFEDHEGYNGVFLGKPNENWHLEFTTSIQSAAHQFDADDIWVFYPETMAKYEKMVQNIGTLGLQQIQPVNPYWENNGIMIQDPDGYRIVISNQKVVKP